VETAADPDAESAKARSCESKARSLKERRRTGRQDAETSRAKRTATNAATTNARVYSHSIVAGGLELMSNTTRDTP
jgi:uncharacterized coiled-coil DUF342 family protein